MQKNEGNIRLQYTGFSKTPLLWKGKTVFDLNQFKHQNRSSISFNLAVDRNLRLGKLVERFVSFDFQNTPNIKIIAENIQIQNGKITLGEFDCLLVKNNTPIHIEIIYKFYLYNPKVNESELHKWVGPNLKDSLVKKLKKLKDKQFPLLFSKQSEHYLEKLNLVKKNIKQQVYFKAQLYIPFTYEKYNFSIINNNCIIGSYCNYIELSQFSKYKFYIPNKHDWLIIPHKNVTWRNYKEAHDEITKFIKQERSPLCWIKKNNGELIKLFVVWW